MSDNDSPDEPRSIASLWIDTYTPSPLFMKYLALSHALLSERDKETETWSQVDESREAVVSELLSRNSTKPGDLFEKLYIWRMEAFEPGENGFVYFNDRSPLSAYLGLINESKFGWARTLFDDECREALNSSPDKTGPENDDCESPTPLFRQSARM